MQIIVTPEELRAYEGAMSKWYQGRMDAGLVAGCQAHAGMTNPDRDWKAAAKEAIRKYDIENQRPKLIPPV